MHVRLIVSSLLLATTPSFAMDLLVPEDYPTVQQAVDAAKDGDVVLIAPGVWTGTGTSVLDTLAHLGPPELRTVKKNLVLSLLSSSASAAVCSLPLLHKK